MASFRRAWGRGVCMYETALGAAKLGHQPRATLCEHTALQEGFGWHLCPVDNVRRRHSPGGGEVWGQTGRHWRMGGRRWKRAGGQSGPGESRQGCPNKGCVLQTAAITEHCVGNTKYVNRQQLGLQHGAPPTTKGDDLAGGPGTAWVSLNACPGAGAAGCGQVFPPTAVACFPECPRTQTWPQGPTKCLRPLQV